MKTKLLYALLVIIISACSDGKEILTPNIPQQNSLPIVNQTISLNYLQRDTIEFPSYINPHDISLTIIEGNSYITIIEKVAKVEHRRIPSHMVDYEELVSIGIIAVQAMIKNKIIDGNYKTFADTTLSEETKKYIKEFDALVEKYKAELKNNT